jgi:hypothetical protein
MMMASYDAVKLPSESALNPAKVNALWTMPGQLFKRLMHYKDRNGFWNRIWELDIGPRKVAFGMMIDAKKTDGSPNCCANRVEVDGYRPVSFGENRVASCGAVVPTDIVEGNLGAGQWFEHVLVSEEGRDLCGRLVKNVARVDDCIHVLVGSVLDSLAQRTNGIDIRTCFRMGRPTDMGITDYQDSRTLFDWTEWLNSGALARGEFEVVSHTSLLDIAPGDAVPVRHRPVGRNVGPRIVDEPESIPLGIDKRHVGPA